MAASRLVLRRRAAAIGYLYGSGAEHEQRW